MAAPRIPMKGALLLAAAALITLLAPAMGTTALAPPASAQEKRPPLPLRVLGMLPDGVEPTPAALLPFQDGRDVPLIVVEAVVYAPPGACIARRSFGGGGEERNEASAAQAPASSAACSKTRPASGCTPSTAN